MAPSPGVVQAGGHLHRTPSANDCGTNVCAVEMKQTTKAVYGSVCKDYCRPHCCLTDFFHSCFGAKCSGSDCGTVHTYKVLMKKTVPGPDVPVCRVKDLSVPICDSGAPGPLPNPTPLATPKVP